MQHTLARSTLARRTQRTDPRDVTEHGRAVKAGGGIAPDVVADARQLGELERSLLQRGLFFQVCLDLT